MRIYSGLRGGLGWALVVLGMGFVPPQGMAATPPAPFSIVLMSDLHFDPFHDPAKVAQLVSAPLDQWNGILSSPDSQSQSADFDAVQKTCKAKEAMDSPYALLNGALKAAKAQAAGAKFVEVSGDLLVHDLDCRYRASMKLPKAKGDDQSVSASFAEKTTVFVIKQVESAFAGVPVYLALGNNDSRCNHNRLDLHDAYLQATGEAVIDGLIGASAAERTQAQTTYESAGYYRVTMAAPMEHTRLLAIDDIYMMSKFANCEADDTDKAGAQEQIAWLTKELDDARQHGDHVWVLGHLPPAVNPKSSLGNRGELCASGSAEAYLSSDQLTNALTSHADIVRLAIFGHTHMDELHLLGSKASGVPVKVVPSVSPVDGNTPSFTVGKVDGGSATLLDYVVYKASNTTGVGTTWAKEYGFKETYHEDSFSAKALDDLIGRFHADNTATTAESLAYEQHYAKNGEKSEPAQDWATYACSLDHSTADRFKACVCSGK